MPSDRPPNFTPPHHPHCLQNPNLFSSKVPRQPTDRTHPSLIPALRPTRPHSPTSTPRFLPSLPRRPLPRQSGTRTVAPELEANDSTESINKWFSSVPNVQSYDIKLKVAYVGPFLLRHAVNVGDCDAVRNIIKIQRTVLKELSTREDESLLRVASGLESNSEDMVKLLVQSGLCKTTSARLDNVTEYATPIESDDRRNGNEDKGWTELNDGRTALYMAAAKGDRQMVKLLVESGADPTIVGNQQGMSAIDAARDAGHKEVVEILERGEEVLNAARRGEITCLDSLLKNYAKINYRDQYGLTAIHAAAIKGHKGAVSLLLEYGCNIECEDNEGHTPLHLAVEGGSLETVELLINNGANLNAKSKKGATPLYIAQTMGYEEISEVLLCHGAAVSLPSSSLS